MYSNVHLKRGSFCFCSVVLALSNEPALCLPVLLQCAREIRYT